MTEPTTPAAPSGTVGAVVLLPYQRQWIERMTGMKPGERLCLYANRWSGKRYAYEAMRRIREMQQNAVREARTARAGKDA